jgi:fatty-acyl-CoA synthase
LARPLLIVAKKSGAEVSKDSMLKFYKGRVARWFLPLRA